MQGRSRFWVVAPFALVLGGGVDARASAVPPTAGHPTGSRSAPPAPDSEGIAARVAALPLRFESNDGQLDPRISFLARGSGYLLFLTRDGATLSLHRPNAGDGSESAVLAMRVAGGRAVQPSPSERLPGRTNYFVGNDPSMWRTGVEVYARVRYPEVLPGVDVVYYGTEQGRLEYDLVLAPGADPKSVALAFEGAQNVAIDGDGEAVIRLRGGDEIVQPVPVAYQVDALGRRVWVDARYAQRDGGLGFAVGPFDGRRALVIDPTLVYSTYLGGLASEGAFGVGIDGAGEAFVAGTTSSANFPTASPLQGATGGGRDVFVTKLSADGSTVAYSTYLGGSMDDYANGIAIDTAGEAFVTGATASANFPTASPLQGAYGGGPDDAFVAKLDATGSALVYSTYVGGSVNDQARGIAVDAAGEAVIAGFTSSSNFPTASALQSANHAPSGTAFVTKLNAAGGAFVYSTYLGGSSQDQASGIAVDASGDAFVAGFTTSMDFPTASPLQATYGGAGDAFVAKLNGAGSLLEYSTYLGGSGSDAANGIALDTAGEAFVAGNTTSSNFPTVSPLQSANHSPTGTSFAAKLASAGSSLAYSTYLGGSGADYATAIAVDGAGEAFVAGYTSSTDFPIASPIQGANSGKEDAFVTKLAASGSTLVYSTYLGEGDNEQAYAIALDPAGGAVIVGETASTNFPTSLAIQAVEAGKDDAFITKVSPSSVVATAGVPALGTKGPFLAALLLLGGAAALRRGRRRVAVSSVYAARSP